MSRRGLAVTLWENGTPVLVARPWSLVGSRWGKEDDAHGFGRPRRCPCDGVKRV